MDPLLEQFNLSLYRSNVAIYNGEGQDVTQYLAGYYVSSPRGVVTGLSNLGSGDYAGDFSVAGGAMRSTNFKTGTSGWELKHDGTFEAASATLTGSITATSGAIGGFTITATQLSATNFSVVSGAANTARVEIGTGSNIGGINSGNASGDIGFWSGSTFANRATAPFRVDMSGNLTATSATITGAITATSGSIGSFTIGTYLYTGTKTAYNDANAGVHIGSDGIGIGNNVFTVSSAGALVATSATITGAINATSGTFSGTITASGTISGGTISGASIVGGTVETSSTGLRTVLDSSDDRIKFMSSSTVYSSIYPYAYPQGNGIYIGTGSTQLIDSDAYVSIQSGTVDSATIGTSIGSVSINGNNIVISGKLQIPVGTNLY